MPTKHQTHPAIALLKGLIGPTALARGLALALPQNLLKFEAIDGGVSAQIQGTESTPYSVRVWAGQNGAPPRGACTCPVGLGRAFCKHQVALWAAWQVQPAPLAGDAQATAPAGGEIESKSSSKSSKLTPLAMLGLRLEKASAEELRAWVLALAQDSKTTLQQLLALSTPTSPDLALSASELKTSVNGLLGRQRFLDYGDSNRYAKAIEPVLALYDRVLASGQFEVAWVSLSAAILKLDRQVQHADDSNGSVAWVLDELCARWWQAAVGHLSALNMQKIAQQWVALYQAMGYPDGLRQCLKTPLDQAPVLQVQLIQSIASKLAAVPILNEFQNAGRHLQQEFALWLGDVDGWIALERQSEYCSAARIMQVLHDAQRDREAIQVGEVSLRSNQRMDAQNRSGVRQLLAQIYVNDGLNAEALELLWLNFKDCPTPPELERLQQGAARIHGAGTPAALDWTAKALAFAQALCEAGRKANVGRDSPPLLNYSLYIELLLAENQFQVAYDLLQQDACCAPHQFSAIGAWRIQHDPLSGFQFTVKQCDEALSGYSVNRSSYERVYALLAKAAPCMGVTLEAKNAYLNFIQQLKLKHVKKTSFIPMLNDALRLV